jgi:phosphoesterase RecJ-like protein
MPGIETTVVAPADMAVAQAHFAEAEVVFCLDFSGAARVEPLSAAMLASPGRKVMIDHHIGPEAWPDLLFHTTKASSTAELVFRLIAESGDEGLIDLHMAECLYTGIMTDTGSFRFSSTTPDVHRITAQLLEKGVNAGRIHNVLFDNFSVGRTRFLGYVLHQKLKVLPDYHTAYMTISAQEQEEFGIQQGDTEGFVNYNLSLEGILFGVLLIERPKEVKLSFRSIGSFPCNTFASNFSGGGHLNASGGQSPLGLAETEARFLQLLEEYKPLLISHAQEK